MAKKLGGDVQALAMPTMTVSFTNGSAHERGLQLLCIASAVALKDAWGPNCLRELLATSRNPGRGAWFPGSDLRSVIPETVPPEARNDG